MILPAGGQSFGALWYLNLWTTIQSQGTVKGRVNHIFAKLCTNGRTEATHIAIKRGLVSPSDSLAS